MTTWPDVAMAALAFTSLVLTIGFMATERWPWEKR